MVASLTEEERAVFRRKRQEAKRIHRAKKYGSGGRHTEAEWQALLGACSHCCVKCGSKDDISRDHIVPITRGGSDDISNIQPLCRPCNSGKNRWGTTDYRTGESLAALDVRLEECKCATCNVPFRLTNKRKKFCSHKCAYTAHNRKKSAERIAKKATNPEQTTLFG